jgi:hypothetical protein
MPRFFFDIRDGQYIRDDTGVELSGLQDARIQAVTFAASLLRDDPGGVFWSGEDWQVEVRDERSLMLFTLSFLVTDSTAPRPSRSAGAV